MNQWFSRSLFAFILGGLSLGQTSSSQAISATDLSPSVARLPLSSIAADTETTDGDTACVNADCHGQQQLLAALEDLPGLWVDSCQFSPTLDTEISGKCKLDFTADQIAVYFEQAVQSPGAGEDDWQISQVIIPKNQIFIRFSSASVSWKFAVPIVEIGFVIPNVEADANQLQFLQVKTGGNPLLEQLYSLQVLDLTLPEAREDMRALLQLPKSISVDNVGRLLETRECIRCDLRDADLANMDLTDVNLEGADLTNANLSGSDLKRAHMVGVNLTGANLSDANLKLANLTLAISSENSKFRRTKFAGTSLVAGDFQGTDFSEAKFSSSDSPFKRPVRRQATTLEYGDFSGANFSNAKLEGVNASRVNFSSANFSYAKFTEFSDKEIDRSWEVSYTLPGLMMQSDLSGAILENANFKKAILTGARLVGASLRNSRFRLANLEGANLSDTDLSNANFDRAYLVNTNLSSALLQETRLTAINMAGANFMSTDWDTSDMNGSTFCNTVMPDGAVSNSDC